MMMKRPWGLRHESPQHAKKSAFLGTGGTRAPIIERGPYNWWEWFVASTGQTIGREKAVTFTASRPWLFAGITFGEFVFSGENSDSSTFTTYTLLIFFFTNKAIWSAGYRFDWCEMKFQ